MSDGDISPSATRHLGVSVTSGGTLSPPMLSPGDRVGHLRVRSILGHGGMGVVYAALDPRLHREVALKILRAGPGRPGDRGHHARVMREARALARLSHPHVVPIFDVGIDRGTLWVAMELVRGPTLAAWLAERPPWPEIVDAFLQAGRGLSAAHAAGLVHRDFKPGNAMVGSDGRVVVLDFGLAWAPGVEGGRGDTTASSSRSVRVAHARDPLAYTLTDAGTVVGTLPYMAPEQHAAHDVDARADQYAFCVSLHEGLAGRRPFGGQPEAMIAAKRSGPPAPPRGSAVPARVWRVIARGLQPDPRRRFASMRELLLALEAARRGPSVRAGEWLMGIGALGLLATISGALLAGPTRPPCAAEARALALYDEPRRIAIAEAFVATGEPGAQQIATRVDAQLAERLQAYREAARAACDAAPSGPAAFDPPPSDPAPSDPAAPAADGCLDRALDTVAVALDLFATADRGTVRAAGRVVAGLPRATDCTGDPTPLAVHDPELRDLIERGRALQQVGRLADAAALAERGIAHARARDDAAGAAAARLLLGGCQMDLGEWDAAQASLEQARHDAVANGDDRVATTAAIKLVHLAAYRLDPDAAAGWLREAEASLERLGDRGQAEHVQLDLARGDLSLTAGHFDDALASYEAALGEAIAQGGEDQLLVPIILGSIGTTRARLGDPETALATYERADAIEARIAGGRDWGRVSIREMMAGSLYELGRVEEALALFEAALVAHEAARGTDHPTVVRMRGNLVLLYADAGRLPEAEALSRRVIDEKRRAFGADGMQVGIALDNHGMVLARLGRSSEALAAYREALRLFELALGHDHVDLSHPLAGVAETSLELSDPEGALAAAERAVALREANGPPADAQLWFLLAQARWDTGDRQAAIDAAGRARAGLDTAGATRPGDFDPDELYAWLRVRGLDAI